MSDSTNMMIYDASKKSTAVAYIFLLLLGWVGAHRFYLKLNGTAATILIFTILGFVFAIVDPGIAMTCIVVVWIWCIVDLFRTAGLVRAYNYELIQRLSDTNQ